MPYEGELADKSSHSQIVRHPDVAEFLTGCQFLRQPSQAAADEMSSHFVDWPVAESELLPPMLIAIDGSWHEGSVDERLLPSTRVGYVQIGCVLIDVKQFQRLRADKGMVDPFAVAKLEDSNSPLVFPLPSSNVRWGGAFDVREGFRAAVDQHFYGAATRFRADDPASSLRSTLFALAARREGPLATGDPGVLRLHRCPNGCPRRDIDVRDVPERQTCPGCGRPVFPTDSLRVWENVEDFQPNAEGLGRLMMAVEHLMPIHYMRWILRHSPTALSQTAFFIDGPLAIFGNAAWIHGPILSFVRDADNRLNDLGLPGIVLVGIQKSGVLVDYMNVIGDHVLPNRLLLVDDDYRYRHVMGSSMRQARIFGSETHYGQDFIYKTETGRVFVFDLAYPVGDKSTAGFAAASRDPNLYSSLSRALGLVQRFESDLYENATIPTVLAHRYTAISLRPGGQVLDLLTRRALLTEP